MMLMKGRSGEHRLRQAREAIGLLLAAALWLTASAVQAQQGRDFSFQTLAPHALLMDADTGTVLFEKAADDLMAPASLAKVMTAAVVFEQIRQGRLKLEDEFIVSENAWRNGGAPSGGSTMFAKIGTSISVGDLLSGLIVLSGNDAAIALAEGIAGNQPSFAGMMTRRAREIGLTKSVFMNPSGVGDPMQQTTARELAYLAKHVIETYPDLYHYFGEREFTWNKIRQQNRNPLLAMEIGADGLKTGNIDESGYGLIGSVVQNGQRLIVVVNGLKNAKDRAQEARKLIDWGFRSFEPRLLFAAGAVVGEIQVYGGEAGSVPVVSKAPVKVLVPRGSSERLVAKIVYTGPLMPPVKAGAEVAHLKVARGDTQALDLPLYAAEDVPVGGLPRRAFDAFVEFGTGFVRRAFSKS